jgi:hypothetical protein
MGEIVRMLQSIGSGVEPAEALQHAGFNSDFGTQFSWMHVILVIKITLGFSSPVTFMCDHDHIFRRRRRCIQSRTTGMRASQATFA